MPTRHGFSASSEETAGAQQDKGAGGGSLWTRTQAALRGARDVQQRGRGRARVGRDAVAQVRGRAAHDVRAHAPPARQQLERQPVSGGDPVRERECLPALQRVLVLALVPARHKSSQ